MLLVRSLEKHLQRATNKKKKKKKGFHGDLKKKKEKKKSVNFSFKSTLLSTVIQKRVPVITCTCQYLSWG